MCRLPAEWIYRPSLTASGSRSRPGLLLLNSETPKGPEPEMHWFGGPGPGPALQSGPVPGPPPPAHLACQPIPPALDKPCSSGFVYFSGKTVIARYASFQNHSQCNILMPSQPSDNGAMNLHRELWNVNRPHCPSARRAVLPPSQYTGYYRQVIGLFQKQRSVPSRTVPRGEKKNATVFLNGSQHPVNDRFSRFVTENHDLPWKDFMDRLPLGPENVAGYQGRPHRKPPHEAPQCFRSHFRIRWSGSSAPLRRTTAG